jgi:type VI secretion system secreted protein VgrG
MSSFLQDLRLLRFISPLGDNVLLPEHLSGVEAISDLFRYQVDLLASADKEIGPADIVGKSVTVGIRAESSGTERFINGIVASFEMCGGDEEFHNYRAWMVPSLWVLTLNKNTRVFQDKTVIDVVEEVLSPYGINPRNDTSEAYKPMEYCTQYRETDLQFISRLMEQHGIFYYFRHSENAHTLTLQDISAKLSECAIQSKFRYAPESGSKEGFYDFVVDTFASKSTMVTGKFTAWDHSFIRNKRIPDPVANADSKGPLGENHNEAYDYADSAAAYVKKEDSDKNIGDLVTQFVNVRRDASDAGTLVAEGRSNAVCLATGFTFELEEHRQEALNTKYLVTRIEHEVHQLPSWRTKGPRVPTPYSNRFTAVPTSIPFRPMIVTPKPTVHGMHTGLVVTPDGEDSYMDKFGRVCVQFWWDRERKPHSPDNTLLRVAQPWAGKGWGTYFWPRVDDEVLIDFIEGDPDQPIVVGSVYNGVNMPKYDPAGQYTLSGVLTRSSKDGGAANANELRFEDLKGKEQVFMNAERDYDLHVENDWHTLVGHEQHSTIKLNQFEEVDGDAHRHVKGKEMGLVEGESHFKVNSNQVVEIGGDRNHKVDMNLKEDIGMNSNIKVGMNRNEKVGLNQSLQVGVNHYSKTGVLHVIESGEEVHIKGGMNVVIEGGLSVCLSGPGGFVSVGPEGVIIQGTLVMINSGGAPIPGTPGMPEDPQAPQSPTAPTDPKFPGDDPPSKPKS